MLRQAVLTAIFAVAANAQIIHVPASGSVSFQSPGFPFLEPNRLQYNTILGPVGKFLQFDTAKWSLPGYSCQGWGATYVDMFDTNGESLGRYCYDSGGPQEVVTSGNSAKVNFRYGGQNPQYGGFNITVQVVPCPTGVRLCPNSDTICLPYEKWCDGVDDCPDGVDEQCLDPSQCGKSMVSAFVHQEGNKIVTEAAPGSWPWQAGIMDTDPRRRKDPFCGGTIISDRWILTEMNDCCFGNSPGYIKVRVGAHNRTILDPWAIDYKIEKIVPHTRYLSPGGFGTPDWDFCLMKTKQKIIFNNRVNQVCLPSAVEALEAPGTQAYVTGWGRLTPYSSSSAMPQLQQFPIRVSSQDTCRATYISTITERMLCVNGTGLDTCLGDSGAPMVAKDPATNAYKLIGLTSWGRGCPAVYARTSAALEWILQNISSN